MVGKPPTMETAARTRTIVWDDPARLAAAARTTEPLAFLQAIRDGTLPPPPIAVLMNFRLVEAERGRVAFEGTPGEEHYNPIGSVHGGYAATILDSALGCAVQTTLDPGSAYATTDLHVRLLRKITAQTGTLRCEGIVRHRGRSHATADATLVGADGKIYASATTGCAIFPV